MTENRPVKEKKPKRIWYVVTGDNDSELVKMVKMCFVPLLNDEKEQKRLMDYRAHIIDRVETWEALEYVKRRK